MGKINAKIRLNQFYVRKQNDKGGKDEPYVFVIYARLDGALNDPAVPPNERILPITFPKGLGHGDLGPDSKGMSVTGRSVVKVPAGIGAWETTLDSTNLDMSPKLLRNAGAAVGVVFMEEDSTLDSTIENALPEMKKEIRKQANFYLRLALGVMPPLPQFLPNRDQVIRQLEEARDRLMNEGLDPNGLIDGSALLDKVLDAVLPEEIGKAAGKAMIPGLELGNIIAAIVQKTDADEFIGANGQVFTFYDLVGRAHAPLKFTFDTFTRRVVTGVWGSATVTNTDKGLYAIDGTARRTDSDEPPVLAAMRGPGESLSVVARRLDGNAMELRRSSDFGKTFATVLQAPFTGTEIQFQSGPGASSTPDGNTQSIVGLATDGNVHVTVSQDAGARWTSWKALPKREGLKSSPAVAVSPSGRGLYVVARDTENAYWIIRSPDLGAEWGQWQKIGADVFQSSPAMVCVQETSPRGVKVDHLVVAGLGTDERVFTTRFAWRADLADQGWSPVREGPKTHATALFTSAPTMATDGAEKVVLVCRANDLRYWRVESFDGGREFQVGTVWLHHGKPDKGRVRYTEEGERRGDLQMLYSAPALVVSQDLEKRVLVGLSPTLGLWRNRHTRAQDAVWHPLGHEPEGDVRVHYY